MKRKTVWMLLLLSVLPFSGCVSTAEWNELRRENQNLRLEMTELRMEMEGIRGDLTALRAASGKALEGKITNMGAMFITIDRNSRDGVKSGDVFDVLRDGGKIGEIKAFEVYEFFSVCSVVSREKDAAGKMFEFKEGDQIRGR